MSKIRPIEAIAAVIVGLTVTSLVFAVCLKFTKINTTTSYTRSIIAEVGICGAKSCAAKNEDGEFIQLYTPAMVGQKVYLYCKDTCSKYWSVEAPKVELNEKE